MQPCQVSYFSELFCFNRQPNCCCSEDDDLPPPLEDMSEQLALREKLSGRTKAKTTRIPAKPAPAQHSDTTPSAPLTTTLPKAEAKSADKKFGGMAKGFLFGGPSKPKSKLKPAAVPTAAATTAQPKTEEDMPFIRANPAASPGQVITDLIPYECHAHTHIRCIQLPEVQEAMKQAAPFLEQTSKSVGSVLCIH